MMFGVLGTAFGLIFFVVMPAALIAGQMADVYFWNTVIFVCLTIGMIQIAKLLLPSAANVVAGIIVNCLCCFRGLHKLRPVISKNLKAHKDKNTKSGIMMLTTVMFLIFLNSFSEQITTLMMDSVRNYLGGDLTAYTLDFD